MGHNTRVIRLEDFGFLAVTGKDAQKFLQGYVTCDLQDAASTSTSMGAVCNIQGRMVTSFRVAASEEGYLLRMDRTLVPVTIEFLGKYIVFSKAEMKDLSRVLHCFGVIGDMDGAPSEKQQVVMRNGNYIVRTSADARFEVWTPDGHWMPPGAEAAAPADWRSMEIEEGIAWVSGATTQEFIPQMFDYHRLGGVDFDKGCYLGQEIVARMQYRGAPSRKLLAGQGKQPHVVGDLLQDDGGKNVGTVVAAEGTAFLAVVQVKDDLVPAVPGCELHTVNR